MAELNREFESKHKNPQLKVMEGVCGRMAQSFRRHYHDLELAQVKKEGVAEYAAEFIAELKKFFEVQLQKKYAGLPVLFQGEGEIPTDSDCWLVHIGGSVVNLAHGREDVHIVMAYVSEGRARSACVFFPMEDRSYTAAYGEGSHTPNIRMRVSGREDMPDSMIGLFSPVSKDADSKAYLNALTNIRSNKMHMRTSGSPVWDMVQVAAGKCDSFIGMNLSAHEVLIGRLFVEESGGRATDIAGNKVSSTSTTIIVGNEKLQPKVYAEIC